MPHCVLFNIVVSAILITPTRYYGITVNRKFNRNSAKLRHCVLLLLLLLLATSGISQFEYGRVAGNAASCLRTTHVTAISGCWSKTVGALLSGGQ